PSIFTLSLHDALPISDIAGVIDKVGRKITKFEAGDPVFAYVSLKGGGGYAEYALGTERDTAAKPKSLSYVEAAAVPIVALTAWRSEEHTSELQSRFDL